MSSTTITSCSTLPSSLSDVPLSLHLKGSLAIEDDDDGTDDTFLNPLTAITSSLHSSGAGSTSPITLYTTTYLTRGASLLPPDTSVEGGEEPVEISLKDRFIPPQGDHALAWRLEDPSKKSDLATIEAARKLESLLSTAYTQCQTREGSRAAEHELFPPGSEFTPALYQLSKTMSMLTSHYTKKLRAHGKEVGERVYEELDEESKSKVRMKFVEPKMFEQRTGTRLGRLDCGRYKRSLRNGNGVLED
ncbi:hypothetical protein CNBG_9203 [Cryptococcus deuterogattii R265]|uniref:Uncharacterized protein n=1 Tax=Cryptococcus deuterogattii (strain R265) TaxID=294750 RepID=A0A0L6DIA2_CRYD2|nr:hypothetical protein I310_06063 [Cryptococcus deuterogattii CA1014]KNX50142.1 hypothetical protein CNBG_9203 [Cryptococcus deuterogattii R265]